MPDAKNNAEDPKIQQNGAFFQPFGMIIAMKEGTTHFANRMFFHGRVSRLDMLWLLVAG